MGPFKVASRQQSMQSSEAAKGPHCAGLLVMLEIDLTTTRSALPREAVSQIKDQVAISACQKSGQMKKAGAQFLKKLQQQQQAEPGMTSFARSPLVDSSNPNFLN